MTLRERWARIEEWWFCAWHGHNIVTNWYAYEDVDATLGAGIRAVGTVYHPYRKRCLDCSWTWESTAVVPDGAETFEEIEGRTNR